MNKAARNEQLKITATWLNGAAIAALAIGCFAPITAFATSATPISIGQLIALVPGWLLVSGTLHLGARNYAGRIEE